MSLSKIALANLRYPRSPEESVELALGAVERAAVEGASIICFPEAYVPGYRAPDKQVPPPNAAFLENAHSAVGAAARRGGIAVVLGTERFVEGRLFLSAVVFNPDGSVAGWQDKVQLDPSEDALYSAGSERRLFHADSLTFGIAICHEGWRYPETVRWAVRRGAQMVFHPHFHEAEPGGYAPSSFADPRNTFHEKAALCRAAENTCWFATVNCASEGSPTTSAVVRPDGTLLAFQPYGVEGLLIVDIDLSTATGLLASRLRAETCDSLPA